jgi:hypothetical protein
MNVFVGDSRARFFRRVTFEFTNRKPAEVGCSYFAFTRRITIIM